MSNLKKVLSVGLASTMVMGMVATSAAAAAFDDFTDKDEIVNKEAVSMVTELGVIAGLPGGEYALPSRAWSVSPSTAARSPTWAT